MRAQSYRRKMSEREERAHERAVWSMLLVGLVCAALAVAIGAWPAVQQ
jgi:hypothetical protein